MSTSFEVKCPYGWTQSKGTWTCLKLIYNSTATWDGARQACMALGSDLVRITDHEKNDLIANMAMNLSNLYIGLSGTLTSGLKWLDDRNEATFFIWKNPSPALLSVKQCGVMDVKPSAASRWDFKNCVDKRNFMCEKGPKICPEEWIPHAHSEKCIRLFYANLDYITSRIECKQNLIGKDLVTIRDQIKEQFISEQVEAVSKTGWWIGYNNDNLHGNYRWLDESNTPQYSNTDPFGLVTGCIYYSYGSQYTWKAEPCSNKRDYICEYSPVCSNQMYGHNCTMQCSPECAGKDNNCFRQTGYCIDGCKAGYMGSACRTVCRVSTYGDKCSKSRLP
ncbi:hypothetical protein RRG08_061510 [Elysia crispata]|uniref:C-type lectin domain-containing protein n=1 Tax=Elysia crispata TaxID=231223 RepID=A0AAE1CRP2_9GAST|nr:hypothetical protein RRG08_061510 [Elysia crispata]